MLPYVQGVSENIGRILKQEKVKVAYKPQQTIISLFPRPKERDDSERQKSGIVYKINCTQCNLIVYYGQTERSLNTRIAERKKSVASFDQWQAMPQLPGYKAMDDQCILHRKWAKMLYGTHSFVWGPRKFLAVWVPGLTTAYF